MSFNTLISVLCCTRNDEIENNWIFIQRRRAATLSLINNIRTSPPTADDDDDDIATVLQ